MHKNHESDPYHEREKEKYDPELSALFADHREHVLMELLLKLVHVDLCELFYNWVNCFINHALHLCWQVE